MGVGGEEVMRGVFNLSYYFFRLLIVYSGLGFLKYLSIGVG